MFGLGCEICLGWLSRPQVRFEAGGDSSKVNDGLRHVQRRCGREAYPCLKNHK